MLDVFTNCFTVALIICVIAGILGATRKPHSRIPREDPERSMRGGMD